MDALDFVPRNVHKGRYDILFLHPQIIVFYIFFFLYNSIDVLQFFVGESFRKSFISGAPYQTESPLENRYKTLTCPVRITYPESRINIHLKSGFDISQFPYNFMKSGDVLIFWHISPGIMILVVYTVNLIQKTSIVNLFYLRPTAPSVTTSHLYPHFRQPPKSPYLRGI